MRLELMTYALRKRRSGDETPELKAIYVGADISVAGMVAVGTADFDCESVSSADNVPAQIDGLPDELARVVRAWPELPDSLRQVVLAIVASVPGTE